MKNPPRLAYFINCFPNLIETMIYQEVAALQARGNTVFTFSIRRPPASDVPPDARPLRDQTEYILPVNPVRLIVAHLRALVRYRRRYLQILGAVVGGTHASLRDRLRTLCHFAEAVTVLPIVERLGVDHLHAHWAVGAATCAMVVSRFLGIPFTFTAHAYDIWRERLLLPQKLRAASLIVTCTDYNRRHLAGTYGVPDAKLRVVHHGVDAERFQPAERLERSEPMIISVGRLVEQKGFDRLLRAYGTLAGEGRPFQVEIVGDGPLRQDLERLARELGLEERVRFTGRLFHETLVRHYAAADAFALACAAASDNDRDGIPNTMIEAMAMELPVVATRFSGIPELVLDGVTGILIDPEDEDALVDALRAVLFDAGRRQRMGRAGRQRVLARFTIETSTAALDEAFETIRGARTSGGQAAARGA